MLIFNVTFYFFSVSLPIHLLYCLLCSKCFGVVVVVVAAVFHILHFNWCGLWLLHTLSVQAISFCSFSFLFVLLLSLLPFLNAPSLSLSLAEFSKSLGALGRFNWSSVRILSTKQIDWSELMSYKILSKLCFQNRVRSCSFLKKKSTLYSCK